MYCATAFKVKLNTLGVEIERFRIKLKARKLQKDCIKLPGNNFLENEMKKKMKKMKKIKNKHKKIKL